MSYCKSAIGFDFLTKNASDLEKEMAFEQSIPDEDPGSIYRRASKLKAKTLTALVEKIRKRSVEIKDAGVHFRTLRSLDLFCGKICGAFTERSKVIGKWDLSALAGEDTQGDEERLQYARECMGIYVSNNAMFCGRIDGPPVQMEDMSPDERRYYYIDHAMGIAATYLQKKYNLGTRLRYDSQYFLTSDIGMGEVSGAFIFDQRVLSLVGSPVQEVSVESGLGRAVFEVWGAQTLNDRPKVVKDRWVSGFLSSGDVYIPIKVNRHAPGLKCLIGDPIRLSNLASDEVLTKDLNMLLKTVDHVLMENADLSLEKGSAEKRRVGALRRGKESMRFRRGGSRGWMALGLILALGAVTRE